MSLNVHTVPWENEQFALSYTENRTIKEKTWHVDNNIWIVQWREGNTTTILMLSLMSWYDTQSNKGEKTKLITSTVCTTTVNKGGEIETLSCTMKRGNRDHNTIISINRFTGDGRWKNQSKGIHIYSTNWFNPRKHSSILIVFLSVQI